MDVGDLQEVQLHVGVETFTLIAAIFSLQPGEETSQKDGTEYDKHKKRHDMNYNKNELQNITSR